MEEERRRLARLREMEQDTMADKVGAAFQLIGSELGAVTSGLTCGLASDGVEVWTKAAGICHIARHCPTALFWLRAFAEQAEHILPFFVHS